MSGCKFCKPGEECKQPWCPHTTTYTFTKESPDKGKVEVVSTNEFIYDLIKDFEDFLRGSGFTFSGELDIVELEDEVEDA